MLRAVAFAAELAISVIAVWALSFLSTFLHEFGHAAGYMLATGDRRWHIRVGWGKRLLKTKALTVNLLVFDGCFGPMEDKADTKAKQIMMLSGGPVISLLLVIGLLLLKISGITIQSEVLAAGTIDFFINFALILNTYILILSVLPIRYFYGAVKGLETDGMQIIRIMRKQ